MCGLQLERAVIMHIRYGTLQFFSLLASKQEAKKDKWDIL